MKWVWRLLAVVVVLAVFGYVGVLGYIYFNQRELQYDQGGRMFALSETKLSGAEQVSMPTSEGQSITGWYQAPQPGKPLILYFRGNYQSFSREHERYEAMVADGYGFLAFDYRGFPGSPGELNQTHVLADGLAAFDWTAAKGAPIVIWGRSLGSGPAAYVASQRQADALLFETPFDSATAVAEERYPYLPVALLMDDKYPVDEWMRDVDEPVFVAHGTADQTIAVGHGKKVYELAKNKDQLWVVDGADHDDLWKAGLWEQAKGFFMRVEEKLGR